MPGTAGGLAKKSIVAKCEQRPQMRDETVSVCKATTVARGAARQMVQGWDKGIAAQIAQQLKQDGALCAVGIAGGLGMPLLLRAAGMYARHASHHPVRLFDSGAPLPADGPEEFSPANYEAWVSYSSSFTTDCIKTFQKLKLRVSPCVCTVAAVRGFLGNGDPVWPAGRRLDQWQGLAAVWLAV